MISHGKIPIRCTCACVRDCNLQSYLLKIFKGQSLFLHKKDHKKPIKELATISY